MLTLEELLDAPEEGLNEWLENVDSSALPFRYGYLQPFWNYVKYRLRRDQQPWESHFCQGALVTLRELYLVNLDLWGNKTVFTRILEELSGLPTARRFFVIEHFDLQDSIRHWRAYGPSYPEMSRLMCRWTEDFIAHVEEIVRRVSECYRDLAGTLLPAAAGRVITVSGSADLHNGRCIHFLTFEDGSRIVYKPRSLKIDGIWHNYLNYLTDRAGLERFTTYEILDKGSYGFSEFLETAPVSEESEFRTFFFNEGFLLGALYFLQGYDIHSENLLACGKYPVIVDVETVIRSGNASLILDREMNKGPFELDSVIRTNMLPFLIPHKSLAPGFDALTGECPNSSNLPYTEKGEKRNGRQYAREVTEGFSLCYDILLQYGGVLFLPGGPLHEIADCQVRVLLRGTAEYQTYLNLLSQKNTMADGQRFRQVLENLKKHYNLKMKPEVPEGYNRLYQEEYASVFNGYTPRMVIRVNERLPYASPYERCLDYLTEKIHHMGVEDKKIQCASILKTLSDHRASDKKFERAAEPEAKIEFTEAYESTLTDEAERWIDALDAALSKAATQGYIIERQHYYFYYSRLEACFSEGYLGVVPALSEWVSITGSVRAQKILQKIADLILTEFSRRAPSVYGEGFVDGLEGICLIAWRAYEKTRLDSFAEIAQKALAALVEKRPKQEFYYEPSLFYSQVASIYTLGAMAHRHPQLRNKLQELSALQLEMLLERYNQKAGLIFGTDGVLLALMTARQHLLPEAREQLDAIYHRHISQCQPENGDYTLATGLAGRFLLMSTICVPEGAISLPYLKNKTFAFGAAGVLFLLDNLSGLYRQPALRDKADTYAARLLADLRKTGFNLNRPFPEPFPSFLYGEGGVYYSLFRHLKDMRLR